MQRVYDFFAAHVAADPAEWQDVRFLHRWRVAEAPPPAEPVNAEALARHLNSGAALRLNERRCLRLDGSNGDALVDARTLRAFTLAGAAALVPALESQAGLGRREIEVLAPDARSTALDLLVQLHDHGLLCERA